MTSTEFTVGLNDGSRVSSKVLKPPGGGSSDIFGLGSASPAGKPSVDPHSKIENSSTHCRVFGDSTSSEPQRNIVVETNIQQNGNNVAPKPKKHYIRRNPITGEEIEMIVETESGDKKNCDSKEVEKGNEESPSVPPPVPTSIRVRNPPGGKSSGIF